MEKTWEICLRTRSAPAPSYGIIAGLDFRDEMSELKCAQILLFQEQEEPALEAPVESQQHEIDSRILELTTMMEVGRCGKSQGG